MIEANEAYFERERKLREQIEAGFPESWKPKEVGEMLVGIFVGRDVGHTQYGQKFIVVVENSVTKERSSVWLLHTALESQFRRAAPNIGEMIAIRYEGKQRSQDGKNEYDGWTVLVDRPSGTEIDWSTPAAGPAAAAAPTVAGSQERYAPTPTDEDIPF